MDDRYRTAFLDWLACAVGGAGQPAAVAARAIADGVESCVAAAAVAGHVLDYDDTYAPGLAHLSAPVAPAALVLGAELGATTGRVLDAYAAGFEAMAQLSAANHPAMRERGWHPTATCGGVGAAVAAADLLELGDDRRRAALRLALLESSGLRAAFGSDGKSLQVGAATAAGVRAARLAAAGASTTDAVEGAWEHAYGARWVEPRPGGRAIEENWIKAYPCCLQTHAAIDAACVARAAGLTPGDGIQVAVHPVSLTAADIVTPRDGLEAKFSIPYLTAYTLLHGAPDVRSFDRLDPEATAAEPEIRVTSTSEYLESEARLFARGKEVARVEAAIGSPRNPMPPDRLAAKVASLAGDRLDGVLDDLDRPAGHLAATVLP